MFGDIAMRINEREYYLLSELVQMDDRALANMIELIIFPTSPTPHDKHLNAFCTFLEESESPSNFRLRAKAYIKKIGARFTISESRMQEVEDLIRFGLLLIGYTSKEGSGEGSFPIMLENAREIAAL
jgi:hypothetical protein